MINRLKDWDETLKVFDADGKKLPEDEINEYSTIEWDDVITAAFSHSKECHDTIDPNKSLYDFFVERTQSMFKDQPTAIAEQKRTKLLQMAQGWGAYVGSPVSRQSLKFFWLEECLEGENPFVAGAYGKILEAVAETAKSHADVRLGCEVVEIRSKPVRRGTDIQSQPSIKLADGSSLEFDEIVLTTPLGWLKENKTAFEPELPPKLSMAIDSISYGHLDKVYITFSSAWWSAAASRSHGSPGWEESPAFTFWLQPKYASSTNPEQWLQECVDLSKLPSDTAHPTLLFYIQGPQSKYISELVSSASSDEDQDAKLIDFFLPYISKLPNYDVHNRECRPKAVLATCWASDKFAGHGSYSNFQVGLEDGDKHIETMRFGMPDRGIWLAGEHTAPFIALGTTTGAYWSGEAVAKRIIETRKDQQ